MHLKHSQVRAFRLRHLKVGINGNQPMSEPSCKAPPRATLMKLGFDPKNVKILLHSHAHLDHSGGLAELKSLTGARLVASEGDRSALEGGFYMASEDDSAMDAPPLTVDRIIADGET